MDIDDWRKKIDEIDLQVLKLLNERANCSKNIGDLKLEQNLPIYSPQREEKIIDRLSNKNQGPLTSEGVRRIFERIIDENRKLQRDEAEKKSKEQ